MDSTVCDEYNALKQAKCAHPFEVLGPFLQNEATYRLWLPEATSVTLSSNRHSSIGLIHEGEGIFSSSETLDSMACYWVDAEYGAHRHRFLDPYQFQDVFPDISALYDPKCLHREMGAQPLSIQRGRIWVNGVRFMVFAPNALSVSVVGDFNHWDGRRHPLQRLDDGFWGVFIPELEEGARYKFELKDANGDTLPHKVDPFGHHIEQFPSFASCVYASNRYQWQDKAWQQREVTAKHTQPLSFYEVHLGSWKKDDEESVNYRQLVNTLIPYVKEMGYTHIELMPINEHPFSGSWGYQAIGIFAPTSRFGSPDDFKYFVDQCHLAGIGVVLDWVPAHFPSDAHGLAFFDGTALFHDADERRGWHPDWKTYIYDFSRSHVQNYLISNALYWLENFHIDGLRVDAVASMLYLDYSREHGQWIPNHDGGNENYAAIDFLKNLNKAVYQSFPNAMTIAEESTAFYGVSKPLEQGGLGFGFKWNMGWMHDSLSYIQQPSIYRQYHHNTLTFPLVYAFSENYVLSLSHDEVVYGKGAMLEKMPGDDWQRHANLRAFLGHMYGQPGKKLNFMGTEIAQPMEWCHEGSLPWNTLSEFGHGVQSWVKDLNHFYCGHAYLFQRDHDPLGFNWRVCDDANQSVLVYERFDDVGQKGLMASNFTPVPRENYRVGVPESGIYHLALNSDDAIYGGGGFPLALTVKTESIEAHGCSQSILLTLPPLATVFFNFER